MGTSARREGRGRGEGMVKVDQRSVSKQVLIKRCNPGDNSLTELGNAGKEGKGLWSPTPGRVKEWTVAAILSRCLRPATGHPLASPTGHPLQSNGHLALIIIPPPFLKAASKWVLKIKFELFFINLFGKNTTINSLLLQGLFSIEVEINSTTKNILEK